MWKIVIDEACHYTVDSSGCTAEERCDVTCDICEVKKVVVREVTEAVHRYECDATIAQLEENIHALSS